MKQTVLKKLLSLFLTLAMAGWLSLGLALSARAAEFSDMPDDWSRPALESAVENGLLMGIDGRIMPGQSLTRAELAAIISRSFGAETPAPLDTYSDVAADAWYYTDMAVAVRMGVFQGQGDRLYPERPVTREETFAVLARAFRLSTTDFSALDGFQDGEAFSSWAKSAAAVLADAGYVNGSGGALNPKSNISRAEFCQLVYNMAQGYLSASGAYTELPNGNIIINTPGVILRNVTVKGDLILGEGVSRDVALDNVRVEGRVLLRGGGLQIGGRSEIGRLIVCSTDGPAAVTASAGADVSRVVVDEGSGDVTLRGSYGSLELLAGKTTVTAENARIGSVDLRGENATLVIGKDSDVGEIRKDTPGADVVDHRPPSVPGGTTPTPPQEPALTSAVCEEDGSAYIYAAFSREMDETSLRISDFTVSAGEVGSLSGVSITAIALKPGDSATAILTLGRTPRPEDTIVLSYTAGSAKSKSGTALLSFADAAVSNRIIGALNIALSEDSAGVTAGSVKLSVHKNTAEQVGYALKYTAVQGSAPAAPVPGTAISSISGANVLGFDETGELAGLQDGDWLAVYGYESGGMIKYFGCIQVEEKHVSSYTARMPLSLTAPTTGPGNRLTSAGDTAPTITVEVISGTSSVTLSGVKATAQTVTVGGTDAAFVSMGGSALAPTFTVDTAVLADLGGSRSFTLTLKETKKLDVVYNLTVTVDSPGAAITGVGSAEAVLQLGETIIRTAETAQSGVKTWSSSTPAVAEIDATSGIVTAKSSGTATLRYITDEGKSNAISVTVYAAAVTADPAIAAVQVGEADVTPTGFTAPSEGESISWASSNTAKATVDSSTGLIHAVAVGETTISYRVAEDSTGRIMVKGSKTITVLGEIAPQLTTLTLVPGDGGGATKVTAAAHTGASSLRFKLQTAVYDATLRVGDAAPAGFDALALGRDILAASGQHLIVVALDADDKVLAISDHALVPADIKSYALYISDYINNAILSCQSDGSALSTLISDVDTNSDSGPMAVTMTEEHLYWAQQDGKAIYCSDLDGINKIPVVDTGSNNISGLAVDTVGDRLYWADYTANVIKSAKLSDGTDIRTVIVNADNSPGSYKGPLALILSGGRLYWAGDVSGKIESCALDGSDRKDAVTTGANSQSVNSLAIYDGKIYWNDYAANRIRRASLTGDGIETVVSAADDTAGAVKGVTAIAVMGGKLYWSCESDGSVRSINVDGSGSAETICAPAIPKRAINGLYCG